MNRLHHDRLREDAVDLTQHRRDRVGFGEESVYAEDHPRPGISFEQVRNELLASHHRMAQLLERHFPAHKDERLVHFALDLLTLATPPNLPYYVANLPSGYTIGGIWLEHSGTTASTIALWLGTRQDYGLPFFNLANGHFKSLPVDPKDEHNSITLAITSGSIATSNIVRGILSTEKMGPAQGAI